jgi:4-amino-4-deoxy-L-arabinose transferase-like glycosyltransferase
MWQSGKLSKWAATDLKSGWWWLLSAACLPLFWINMSESHDWGGDFAQYLQQALNMVQGNPQDTSFYVFNPSYAILAPPAYPVGFPMILTPVVALFGTEMLPLKIWMTLLLILTTLLAFKIFKSEMRPGLALALACLFAYHPWLLQFKGEILADIPFTLLLTIGLLLWQSILKNHQNWGVAVLAGVAFGFALLTKNIGIIVFPALLASVLWSPRSFLRNLFVAWGITTVVALVFYVIWSHGVFPVQTETVGFSSGIWAEGLATETVFYNTAYYTEIFQSFFHQMYTPWNFLALISKALLLAFLLFGYWGQLFKRPDLPTFLVSAHLLVLLVFPVTTQGLRYLLPILPWLILLIVRGWRQWQPEQPRLKYAFLFFLLCSQLHQSYHGVQYANHIGRTQSGPSDADARSMFAYLSTTSEEARLVFIKPRPLGLYTSRTCFANNPHTPYPEIVAELEGLGWDFLVTSSDLPNPGLAAFIEKEAHRLLPVFQQGAYTVYSRK